MKLIIGILLAALTTLAFADNYVRGHIRRDGTYVQPHFKSEPNNTNLDNYSTRGNVNPYTGDRGYEQPQYFPQQLEYPNNQGGYQR